jgi:phage terminase large subunit
MGSTTVFKPTAIQKKALALLKSGAKHILLFGGSRSGKTTVLVVAIIYRALRFAGSRHLICRYRVKDARSSVLRETLLPWLDNTIGKGGYTYLAHESMVTLFNGSEIWIGGLGDREQADKILGHEYNTIYFNEISQLSYAAVTTAYSRLAMRVPGCRNLFVYDYNPGSPLHWSYKIFVHFSPSDPAGGERIQEITGGIKANNSVESGIDFICAKIERRQFYVCETCTGVLSEVWDYCRDEAGEIVKVKRTKVRDHFMDALRYAVFSDVRRGVSSNEPHKKTFFLRQNH